MISLAIIQARYNSSRLRGKVMKRIGEKTVLSHVLSRASRIKGIDNVCCAISEDKESDIIVDEAEKNGALIYRGSEKDVLERYYLAAKFFKADRILRITSDCPLIDPEVCQMVIDLFDSAEVDYVANNMPPSWPHGLDCEFFSYEWLEEAHLKAKKIPEREHVTPYIRTNSRSKKLNLSCPTENLANNRWTLDTERDLEFFETLFTELGNSIEVMGWRDILDFIIRDRSLLPNQTWKNLI